jgi:hypothetical protein
VWRGTHHVGQAGIDILTLYPGQAGEVEIRSAKLNVDKR